MANIEGYVNPREIGNKEPNQMFRMDIFIENDLWTKYVAHPDEEEQNLRTYNVCSMLLHTHHGESGGKAIDSGKAFFEVDFDQAGKHEVVALRAYTHPEVMALCVGLKS